MKHLLFYNEFSQARSVKYCHAERSEGSLYEVPTSSPWMCTNIVATGSNGCSPWKQHHGSLADLRCQETGGVTRLVTHTGLSRWAERCFASLSMTVPNLNTKTHYRPPVKPGELQKCSEAATLRDDVTRWGCKIITGELFICETSS